MKVKDKNRMIKALQLRELARVDLEIALAREANMLYNFYPKIVKLLTTIIVNKEKDNG